MTRTAAQKAEQWPQREPKRDGLQSFTLPKIGGVEYVRDLVSDYGGIDRVSKELKVAPDLVNRYITGQIEAPYVFLLALWWQSSHGFKQAFSEVHWTHNYNCFKRREAEEKVRSLERVLKHAEALLEHRSDAAALVREMLDHALPAEQGTRLREVAG
jgi:hypothetical protein